VVKYRFEAKEIVPDGSTNIPETQLTLTIVYPTKTDPEQAKEDVKNFWYSVLVGGKTADGGNSPGYQSRQENQGRFPPSIRAYPAPICAEEQKPHEKQTDSITRTLAEKMIRNGELKYERGYLFDAKTGEQVDGYPPFDELKPRNV